MVQQEKTEALLEEAEDMATIPSDMPVDREIEITTSQQFPDDLLDSFTQPP